MKDKMLEQRIQQSLNAESPSQVTLFGIVTLVRPLQPLNAALSMDCKPSDSVRLAKA